MWFELQLLLCLAVFILTISLILVIVDRFAEFTGDKIGSLFPRHQEIIIVDPIEHNIMIYPNRVEKDGDVFLCVGEEFDGKEREQVRKIMMNVISEHFPQ